MAKELEQDDNRSERFALFEDLHSLELKVDIDYILNCDQKYFYELMLRYAPILRSHNSITKERRRFYKDFLRR